MSDPIDIAEGYSAEPYGDGYIICHSGGGRAVAQRDMAAAVREITRLRAALAAQVPQPAEFNHDIGADRYTVHRGAFWWHVHIGDSMANVGKFYTRNEAEDMALKLLTAFRDGAFAQHRAAPGASPPAALAVPAGMALVPVEPTPEMVAEIEEAARIGGIWTAASVYRAMVAAYQQESATTRERG